MLHVCVAVRSAAQVQAEDVAEAEADLNAFDTLALYAFMRFKMFSREIA